MILRRAAARRIQALALAWILAPWAAGPLVPPVAAQDSTAVTEPQVPRPVGFVNDRASVLSEPTRAKLEAFLDQLRTKTGAEFGVLTVRTTAPLTPSEYKVKVFESWGLGKRGEDDGLLLLLAIEEREAWFETGYGLEGILPDGLEARIVREEMSARFRAGDYDGCVVAGVQAAALRIGADKGVGLEWDGRELRYTRSTRVPRSTRAVWLSLVIWLVIALVFSRMRSYPMGRRRGLWGGGPYWGGFGGGWGGGGWGGGFGGGGSSFGGFGGGASGGGGGGGRL